MTPPVEVLHHSPDQTAVQVRGVTLIVYPCIVPAHGEHPAYADCDRECLLVTGEPETDAPRLMSDRLRKLVEWELGQYLERQAAQDAWNKRIEHIEFVQKDRR